MGFPQEHSGEDAQDAAMSSPSITEGYGQHLGLAGKCDMGSRVQMSRAPVLSKEQGDSLTHASELVSQPLTFGWDCQR